MNRSKNLEFELDTALPALSLRFNLCEQNPKSDFSSYVDTLDPKNY